MGTLHRAWRAGSMRSGGRRSRRALRVGLLACLAWCCSGCGPDEVAGGVPADAGDPVKDIAAPGDQQGTPKVACENAFDCPAAQGICLIAACQPAVGCVVVHKIDGAICEDGNPCTEIGGCKQGQCEPGPSKKCDDKDPCTQDACDPLKGCVHMPLSDVACDDGDACTQGDQCQQGACKAGKGICQCTNDAGCAAFGDKCQPWYCNLSDPTKPKCQPNPALEVFCSKKGDTACLKNTCDPSTGQCALVALASPDKKLPCEDGNPCTTGDHCVEGQCQAGTDTCGCKTHEDCVAKDDGNLCNGTYFCNKSKTPATCEFNPATVVVCPSVADTDCAANQCNPQTGACSMVAVNEGSGCNDDNPCTEGESCTSGKCSATTNTCICKTDAECAAKDDGDLCNGQLFCDKSSAPFMCKLNPATVVNCQSVDDTQCLKNQCAVKTGKCALTVANEGGACDDANACTQGEVCTKGVCKAGDAANTCECNSDADCKAKDDNNLCNGSLYCDKTSKDHVCKINPATVVQCSGAFDTTCLANTCLPQLGTCSPQPVHQGLPCDDGMPCTEGEYCISGKCAGGKDLCACHKDVDCAGEEDGNLCNGTLYCDKAKLPWSCKLDPTTVVTCPTVDDTFCMARKCQPKTGDCQFSAVNQGIACKGASACMTDAVCKNGACAGPALACDDGVACTVDACDDITGCTHTPNPLLCDDGDACTDDLCKPLKGCLHSLNQAPCDDGNACTDKDTCGAGKCAGKKLNCDDNEPCTDDPCDPKSGCAHQNNTAPCGTGQKCQPLGTCAAGKCVPDQTELYEVLFDGAKDDAAAGVIGMEKGEAVAVGTTWSKGAGKADFWLRRLDKAGKTVWESTIGGGGDEQAWASTPTSDGGGVVVGSVSPGLSGGADGFAVRFGVDGAVKWKQAAGEAQDDSLRGVSALPDDELIAAGRLGKAAGDSALWMVRISGVGAVIWQRSYAGKAGDGRAAVAVSKGFALTGSVAFGAKATPVLTVVRADAKGEPVWQKELSGLPGRGEAIAALPDGSLVVAGSSGAGPDDARLVRLDSQGAVLWDQLFGGSGKGVFTALTRRPDGTLAVVGLKEEAGAMQTWLLQTDASGKTIWQRTLGAAVAGSRPGMTVLEGAGHVVVSTVAGATGQGSALRVRRTDFWGYTSCEEQGECATKVGGQGKSGCDDANPCTNDTCVPLLGCHHTVNLLPCDDGDVCTLADTCEGGKCAGKTGQGGKCDDGNVCTADTCDPVLGCTFQDLQGACSDGDACTQGDVCATGLCKPGSKANCSDGNACTDDLCDPKSGCTKVANTAPCVSGTCTYGDQCAAGFCKSSGKSVFIDGYYGGVNANHAQAVEEVGADGFVLGGYTHDNPDSDGLIVRVDASGKASWSAKILPPIGCCGVHSNSKTTQERFYSVLPTAFGMLAVGTTGLCDSRGLISRLEASGKVVWTKLLSPNANCGGGGRTYTYDIASGHDGTYGLASTRVDWPYNAATTRGQFVRIDQNGTIVNHQTIGGGSTNLRAIARAEGSGYTLAGGATSDKSGWQGYVVRVDPSGAPSWGKMFGGAGSEYFYDLALASDGGNVVVGRTTTLGEGGHSGWVVRLAPDGAQVWSRAYGGPNNDQLHGVTVAPADKIAAFGFTYSKGPGAADMWLLGLDSAGNVEWERTYGTPKDDFGYAVARMESGGLALAGSAFEQGAGEPSMRLQTVDAFGWSTCAASGGCHALTVQGCDDANPCTSDGCAAGKGCTHAAMGDGVSCAPGKKCTAGVCK